LLPTAVIYALKFDAFDADIIYHFEMQIGLKLAEIHWIQSIT